MTSLTSTCTVYLSVWGLEKTRPSMCALFSLFVQLQIRINHVISAFTFAPFVQFSRRQAAGERSKTALGHNNEFLVQCFLPRRPAVGSASFNSLLSSLKPSLPFAPKCFCQQSSFLSVPLCGGYRISVTSYQRCWTRLRQATLAERIVAARKLLCAPQSGSPFAWKTQ